MMCLILRRSKKNIVCIFLHAAARSLVLCVFCLLVIWDKKIYFKIHFHIFFETHYSQNWLAESLMLTRSTKTYNFCNGSAEGLFCAGCGKFVCVTCINEFSGTLTGELFARVSEFTSSIYRCRTCSPLLLPRQLLKAGYYTEKQLLSFGINKEALNFNRLEMETSAPVPVTTTPPATTVPTTDDPNIPSSSLQNLLQSTTSTSTIPPGPAPVMSTATTVSGIYPGSTQFMTPISQTMPYFSMPSSTMPSIPPSSILSPFPGYFSNPFASMPYSSNMPPFSGYQGQFLPPSGFAPQYEVRPTGPAIPVPQIKLPHFDGSQGIYQG